MSGRINGDNNFLSEMKSKYSYETNSNETTTNNAGEILSMPEPSETNGAYFGASQSSDYFAEEENWISTIIDWLPDEIMNTTLDDIFEKHGIDETTEISKEDFHKVLKDELGLLYMGIGKLEDALGIDIFDAIAGDKETITMEDIKNYLSQMGVEIEEGMTIEDIINCLMENNL